jgi:hypothetical protein
MDKAKLEQYLNTAKETISNMFANIDIGTADFITGIIVVLVLFLAWGAFKFGVKIGKTSLDYNHKLDILSRVSKVFYEVQGAFNELNNAAPEDSNEELLRKQAAQLKKLSKVLRKDAAMWSMTAPTHYLDHTQKLIEQIEGAAKKLAKAKITNKMGEKKIKGIIVKYHTPVLSTYEKMVIAMRKDIRSDGISKIIKQIIRS